MVSESFHMSSHGNPVHSMLVVQEGEISEKTGRQVGGREGYSVRKEGKVLDSIR